MLNTSLIDWCYDSLDTIEAKRCFRQGSSTLLSTNTLSIRLTLTNRFFYQGLRYFFEEKIRARRRACSGLEEAVALPV
jgi:hypothetical protein